MHDELLTVDEVAQRLKINAQTIRRWLREGRLNGTSLGTRQAGWRVPASEVHRFIEQGKRPAGADDTKSEAA